MRDADKTLQRIEEALGMLATRQAIAQDERSTLEFTRQACQQLNS